MPKRTLYAPLASEVMVLARPALLRERNASDECTAPKRLPALPSPINIPLNVASPKAAPPG